MGRAYAGAAGTHMFFGLLSIAAGVTWICLLYFYEPLQVNTDVFDSGITKKSLLETVPVWVTVLMSAKIICGFWFFITGAVGCCIKSRGCTEGVFVALNVLNVIIWAPALLLVMCALGYMLIFGTAILASSGLDTEQLEDLVRSFVWLWAFPGVGVLVGVVEFILSIVSYSIVCCCRPSSLDDGYEYQYEMK